MRWDNRRAKTALHGPSLSADRNGKTTPTPGSEGAGGVAIDFHSAEFNRTDDLWEYPGNLPSFEPLDGVVTAHERHIMESRRERGPSDPLEIGRMPAKSNTAGPNEEEPVEPLTVISEGRVLVIDSDRDRAVTCGKTLEQGGLFCTLVVVKSASSTATTRRGDRRKVLEVDGVSVTGAFGAFSAVATVRGEKEALVEWHHGAARFDLVLDLQVIPAFSAGSLPLGYYAPGPDPAALDEAMAELPEMRGQFEKPQFVSFREDRCFRGRSRTHECRRCLEVCPVGAIRPADHKISIDHALCQGCGGCALLCPADAIRVVEPSQEHLLNELVSRLRRGSTGESAPVSLVISDVDPAAQETAPAMGEDRSDPVIIFNVAHIAHVRLHLLLAAFAYGARDALVLCRPGSPSKVKDAVELQVMMARAILRRLGLGEERVRFSTVLSEGADLVKATAPSADLEARIAKAPIGERASFLGEDPRALVRSMAQLLRDQWGFCEPWLPLPSGSPFGAVSVSASACTLCMACVTACPSGALSTGDDAPRLLFSESRCHQCGLCREICPEQAVQLVPRILLDCTAGEPPAVLCEREPFRCIVCGVPFASPALIDHIGERLAGHWMYASERQARRLKMCGACRTRDALASEEMQSWRR